MNFRAFRVLLLLGFLACSAINVLQAQQAAAGTFGFEHAREPLVTLDASNTGGPTPLDAPWRLHFGDDPAFAQPGFDDSQWTLHRIDKDWASVSLLVGTLRTLAEGTDSPAELLDGLNRRLIGRSSGFTTCLILRVDPDGTCVVANAGHLPPYVDGREVEMDTGLVLGISTEASYEETVVRLEDGARLTLFTDGVVEARSRTGELYGFDRAAAVAGAPAAQIAAEAQAFGQEDDITVVSVTRAVVAQAVVV